MLKWFFFGVQEECERRASSAVYSSNFPDLGEDRLSHVEHHIETLVFWSFCQCENYGV